jgi:hypothetical protein
MAGAVGRDVMFGGLTEKEAAQAALEVTLDVEMALLERSALIAALLDYSKFFDMLPWEILWPLARWWGAPDEVVAAMERFYKQLKSRFKIGSHFGEEWTRTNSVAQGCPLSVMWANMLAAAWVKVMRREAPNTKKNVFIDDKSLRSSSRADFELAFKVTDEFDMRCGQKLNIGKVVAFATDPRDRTWLQQWRHGGHKIQEVKEAVSLGHETSVNKRAKRERQHERLDRSRHTLERIANMSAPLGAKRRIVEGKAIPQVVMVATVTKRRGALLQELRSKRLGGKPFC